MKIVFDNIIFSLQKVGGISVYWYEIIKRIDKEKSIFYESKNENILRKKLNIVTEKESRLKYKFYRYLPFIKKLPPKSLFHSSYYRVALQKDILNITTVHDFTYEYFRSGIAKYIHMLQKGYAIKKSDGIICVSENTKKDLLKFYPQTDESKIKVIYNGVGEEFKRLDNPNNFLKEKFEILHNKKYILYVGSRSGYKNFLIAVKLLKEYKEYKLVVVGNKFNVKEKRLINDIKNNVYCFEGVTEEELNILYNNAFCLLYPSSYEGFGIPLLEAMKAGCPVVSSNFSSIPEVVGGAAFLVNKITINDFMNEINKLKDKEVRETLILKGLIQVEKFSWSKCYEETIKFYEKIWNGKYINK